MLRDTTGSWRDLALGRQILGVEMLPMKEVSHICKLVQGVIDSSSLFGVHPGISGFFLSFY